MKKFEFSSSSKIDEIFSGQVFYFVFKNSEFLRHSQNVETILAKNYELRNKMKELQPGEILPLTGMFIKEKSPLLIKKTGANIKIENFEFTVNRLNGLVAAYAFDNRQRFPGLTSSEATSLGLTWDNEDVDKSRLFLSCVSGTEHFYDQFRYYPLICALRKLHLEKITSDLVIKIARKKNPQGKKMATELMENLLHVRNLWKMFPVSETGSNLKQLILSTPKELKDHFMVN